MVEDRFDAAIDDAKRADSIIADKPAFELLANYPILGVPFTVKESCSLKGKNEEKNRHIHSVRLLEFINARRDVE